MDYDKKVYFRYIWNEHLNIKRFIKSSVFFEYILIFILFYSVYFTNVSLKSKVILTISFLFVYSFIKFLGLYKSGVHRAWNRRRTGMLTKSQLNKLKNKDGISKQEDSIQDINEAK